MTSGPFRRQSRLQPLLGEAAAAYRRRDDEPTLALLRDAAALAPERLDLRFDIAGRHTQDGAIDRAMTEYRAILAAAPLDVRALTLAAHWARRLGLDGEREECLSRLRSVRPARAAELQAIWEAIDLDAGLPVPVALPDRDGADGGLAVVTLGYALREDGTMREPMFDRLHKTLDAAARYPEAAIIVTGGVPRAGRAEAAEMRRWLVENGVDAARVHEEGYARDVVENLLYARNILEMRRARRAVFITSVVNVRRVRVLLSILRWAAGSAWEFDVVGAKAGGAPEGIDPGPGNVKVYRDALRVYGLFMMQSPPELVEL